MTFGGSKIAVRPGRR